MLASAVASPWAPGLQRQKAKCCFNAGKTEGTAKGFVDFLRSLNKKPHGDGIGLWFLE